MRALALVLLSLAEASCTPSPPQYPSDAEMIANLNENIGAFEDLIQMFRDDQMTVVHTTWIQPAGGISEERWAAYKDAFERLHLDGGMRTWGGDSIWFVAYSSGLATGGSGKGYMYKPVDPSPRYQSLDAPPKDLASNVRAYRRARNDWYIEYSWDD